MKNGVILNVAHVNQTKFQIMYFEGKITIDPSELTKIHLIKPTKAFKRMLYHLTFGGITEKQERETFSAVSILQQLNMSFAQKGITNIIRLSHDDIDFYLDTEGKTDDLKEALDHYELESGDALSAHFNNLLLVLEHDDSQFKYLLEVKICKSHSVGEYPIEIKVTGLLKEFSAQKGRVDSNLKKVFSSQDKYDDFKRTKLHDFTFFIDDFILCIKKSIKVDNINTDIKTKIVVPKTKIESKSFVRNNRNNGYYGYYGFDDFLFYSMIWSSVSHEHSVMHSDIYYESETGSELGYLEEAASNSPYFNDTTDIDSRTDIFSEPDSLSSDTTSSSGGWFGFGDSDSSSSSDCSSCSSCSSCGGD